ncbi:MAG: alpha/beta hydrolase [Cryobacterium sp.]|nr:alpha/beta hydrolase [Oligoflexia bacterium]
MNLLLIQGLIRDQRCWGDFPERLRHHAPHLKTFSLDLPGIGTEFRRTSPDSVTAIRIDLAKRFHEKIKHGEFPTGPWMLFSTGLGAMVALDWTDAEPLLFKKLVLLNTSSRDVASPLERANLVHSLKILRAVFSNRSENLERRLLLSASNRFAGTDPRMQELLQRQTRYSKERPFSRLTLWRQVNAASAFTLARNKPTSKLLFLSSAADRLVSSECSVRLADRFGAKHHSHPWAGHEVAIDDPEWLAKETADWLENGR